MLFRSQVEQHLVQLAGIGHDQIERWIEVGFKQDILTDEPLQRALCARYQAVELQWARAADLASADGEQPTSARAGGQNAGSDPPTRGSSEGNESHQPAARAWERLPVRRRNRRVSGQSTMPARRYLVWNVVRAQNCHGIAISSPPLMPKDRSCPRAKL